MSRTKPKQACDDCGRNWIACPSAVFHDHIWKAMGMKPRQFLCRYCANRRLFRECGFNDNVAGDHRHSIVQGDYSLRGKGETSAV
jgi:hypothetical protein